MCLVVENNKEISCLGRQPPDKISVEPISFLAIINFYLSNLITCRDLLTSSSRKGKLMKNYKVPYHLHSLDEKCLNDGLTICICISSFVFSEHCLRCCKVVASVSTYLLVL